ncbi:orotidine-5'-phosphate decarboxylase [Plantactinospora mayteni]|uniref:Orotidine-5'-phosphate decarboxylase n=1 Tax=Plantactinospora mayteni TaxID=566021 RepID=A0ABQ4EGX8_9ACTN|nr:orotidine-5'-phosphate decarboxylase [Plantactinospora mayteni]GIG93986.1 orotidine 5'-phosphate decarboxylase [Plantactinospora mayteni]
MTTPFAHRWARLAAHRGPLCLGVAPSHKWLRAWDLSPDLAGARAYCRIVLDAAGDRIGAVKVQTPFFERLGPAGLELLGEFADAAHDRGMLVLADAKRGDADDTMADLAATFLGPDSVLRADAVSVAAFMGFGTLAPLLRHAHRTGTAVFVLVRTSNHGATEAQTAVLPDGRTVAQHLADAVATANDGYGDAGPAAAVVGARAPESTDLLGRLGGAVAEVPGLGRADRDPDEVVGPCGLLRPGRAMLTVTTGVLRHGPDPAALRRSLSAWQAEGATRLSAVEVPA